jgi:ubiquinone biosynthesis protein Coq4
MPPASLGAQLGHFLQSNQLQLTPTFENHEVFHTLLGYDTSAPQEVALQWCLLGNGKRSAYAIMTALVGFIFFPEHWEEIRAAYRRGQQMRPFHHWYFEYLLRENLQELTAFLDYQKTSGHVASH